MKKEKGENKEYSLEDQYLFRHIDHKHPKRSMEQREIGVFCRTLWECMGIFGALRFIWDGNYRKPMLKAYAKLLKKKNFLPKTPKREIENYFGSETRINMITLCSNIISEMKLFYRIIYVIAGMYRYPLSKTHLAIIKREAKKRKKLAKKQNKYMKKMAKKRAKHVKKTAKEKKPQTDEEIKADLKKTENEIVDKLVEEKLKEKK